MSFRPTVSALLTTLLVASFPVTSAAEFVLFRNLWGDVIVATDTSPEGSALPVPSPSNPVYYRGLSLGCKFGSLAGDDLPPTKELNAVVAKILAQQGYVGARPGVNEPTLLLVLQWGLLQPQTDDLLWFLGYDAREDIGAASIPGMLGPEVFRRNFRSRTVESVLESASVPIYGIIVTAFEHESARTENPIAYWQTRIGLPASGKSMAQALPAMALAAGPMIGRASKGPILRDVDTVREGRVKLGEMQVLGFDEPRASTRPAAEPKQ